MRSPTRVLVVRPSTMPFIERDIALLRKHFDVRVVDVFEDGRSAGNRLKVLARLARGAFWADVTYSWFAEVYALWAVRLSRLFMKRSIVVVGGYETADMPEIGYGLMTEPAKARMVRRILRRADKVLAVSSFVEGEVRRLEPTSEVETVHLGVDPEGLSPKAAKERTVVTVGGATADRYVLKGIDSFVEASRSFPDVRFVVVGKYDERVKDELAAVNASVEFVGWVPPEKLAGILDSAKVYCQLSMRESFGMALVEAMSLGCVPVVTDAGALPEVVGGAGMIVPVKDVDAAVEGIRQALESDHGDDARERVRSRFSAAKREENLERVVKAAVR